MVYILWQPPSLSISSVFLTTQFILDFPVSVSISSLNCKIDLILQMKQHYFYLQKLLPY